MTFICPSCKTQINVEKHDAPFRIFRRRMSAWHPATGRPVKAKKACLCGARK